ncbi:MAG TPA: hypothetical protein VFQ20_13045 [Burkholderiaceae bacterium]|nr:hypothetical protein [Burkholderiaceae bacterium]
MPKPIHEMSSWGHSAHPSREDEMGSEADWEATRALTGMATQLMRDKDDDAAVNRQVGRPTGHAQWELFVACEPADAMQQQFESVAPLFIALHDIGTQSSRRMLAGLAAAMGAPVHQLHIRRQGLGVTLARIEFVELRVADPSAGPLRMYTTETDADTTQRRRLARVLMAYSRLAVAMVGDLPPHAMATALMPLREAIIEGPWLNRELLMLPLAGASALAQQAGPLARRDTLSVRTTPLVTRPAEAWAYIKGAWNRQREAQARSGEVDVTLPEVVDPVPQGAAAPAGQAPQAPAVPAAATPARRPLPMQPMPVPRALPATNLMDPALATYLRHCGELKGVISCCIFELATQRTLGHTGARPGPAALASQGASLMASLAEAAQGLALGDAPPDAAVTFAHHHLLLRTVPGRPGLAMHAVLDKGLANLTLVRLQLQRLDILLEEGVSD